MAGKDIFSRFIANMVAYLCNFITLLGTWHPSDSLAQVRENLVLKINDQYHQTLNREKAPSLSLKQAIYFHDKRS
jgi:hypothetical protein